VDILGRKCGLGLRGRADRFGEIAAAGEASVKDAGFVQVQMRFDKSRGHQTASEIDRFALGLQRGRDSRNLPRRDPDVAVLAATESSVLEDEVHDSLSPAEAWTQPASNQFSGPEPKSGGRFKAALKQERHRRLQIPERQFQIPDQHQAKH